MTQQSKPVTELLLEQLESNNNIWMYGGIISVWTYVDLSVGCLFIAIGSKQLSITEPMSKGVSQVSNENPKEKIQLSLQFIQIMLRNLGLQPPERKEVTLGQETGEGRCCRVKIRFTYRTYRFITDGTKNYLV